MRLYRDSVISRIMEKLFPIVDNNKNIETGAATVMMNYAVSLQEKFNDETQVCTLYMVKIKKNSLVDYIDLCWVLMAIGNNRTKHCEICIENQILRNISNFSKLTLELEAKYQK